MNNQVRFYEKKYPEEGDIVYVKTIENNGEIFYVELLDYNNIRGCIPLSEMTRKLKNKKFATIGNKYPAIVMSNKSSLMLSKTKVPRQEISAHTENFVTAKKISYFGYLLTEFYKKYLEKNNMDISDNLIENVMENTIWNYYKKVDGLLNDKNYTYLLNNIDCLFETNYFEEKFKKEFINFFKSHTQKTDIEVQTILKLISYSSNAINDLQKILSIDRNTFSNEYLVDIKIISSPYYSISVKGSNMEKIMEVIDNCVNEIKSRIDFSTTKFNIEEDKKIKNEGHITVTSLSIQEVNKWFND